MDDINHKLSVALQRVRQKSKLEAMLRNTQQLLFDLKVDIHELREKLAKEQADVERLSVPSIHALFYTILGTKEQRLVKEQQELAAAKLKFDQACQTEADLNQELTELQKSLTGYQTADAEYQQVLVQKQDWLLQNDHAQGRAIADLISQIEQLKIDKTEIVEAILAGDAALTALERTQSALNTASNWGLFDLAGGGGMMTSMVKHSYLDDAATQARQAQRALNRFRKELAEAGERLQLAIEVDFVSSFVDGFFDNIMVDWIMQSRINNARQQCIDFIRRTSEALENCKVGLRKLDAKLQEAKDQQQKLLNDS